MPQYHRTERGFTLIELVVTLTLFGIFVAIAVPNLVLFLNQSRALSSSNELLSLLQAARAKAVNERRFIRVCQSGDGHTWALRTKCSTEEEGEPFRVLETPASLSIAVDPLPAVLNQSEIVYYSNGSVKKEGDEESTIRIYIYSCQNDNDNTDNHGYTLEIKSTGHSRSDRTTSTKLQELCS